MKEEFLLSKKITDHLVESYAVGINSNGSLKIDDFSFSGNGLVKRVFKRFFSDRKMLKNVHEPFLLLSDTEIVEQLTNIIPTVKDEILAHINATKSAEFGEDLDVHTEKDEYLSFIPVVDMEHPKGSALMVDKTTGRLSTLEEKSWERIVGQKHVALVREMGHCGLFEYDPRSTIAYKDIQGDHNKRTIFNKFIPPKYRMDRDRSAKLDPRFIEFLEGFFLDSCRDYAYNWLYWSCFKRIPTYLVLVGAGGIGKNLLAEALKNIHGPTNYTKAPASALDTKFNGHLLDCTLLYYDECKFSAGREGATTRKNKLKEWANEYVPIETKGVDAKNKGIFCSCIIATNNDSDVHLEQLDRKFSVMELSEDRLEKRLGLEDTQFLWGYIETEEFKQGFLNYLEDKINQDFNPHVEYKGEKFKSLVLSSLYGWQQDLLYNYILISQTPHVSLKTCKEEISLFPKHNTKVDDFLKNFTWNGESIGKIVTIDGKSKIKINEKLLPPVKEDHPLDKGDL